LADQADEGGGAAEVVIVVYVKIDAFGIAKRPRTGIDMIIFIVVCH